MEISGYVLEEKIKVLKENREQGRKELEEILKKYPGDKEVSGLLEKLDEDERMVIEALENIAYLRKKGSVEGGASLPFSDYRGKKGSAPTR